jgi:hypothetical protein
MLKWAANGGAKLGGLISSIEAQIETCQHRMLDRRA